MTSSAPMPTTLPEVAQLAVQNREDIASLIRLVGQVNHSVQQLAQHQAASHDRLAGQVNDIAQQLAQHQTGAYDQLVSTITDLLRQDRENIAALIAGQERNNAAIAELIKEQAEQRNAIAELRATVAELAETVRELVRSQQTMRTDLATVSGRLANITGTRYEKHAAQSTPRRVRRLFGLRDVTIAHTDWEPGRLMTPIRDSDLISDDEADDVGHIDIVLTGRDAADDVVLIAAEISTTIQDGDVTRAHHRAGLIARASGRSVHPAVIGQSAADYALALADLRSVAVITVPPPVPD